MGLASFKNGKAGKWGPRECLPTCSSQMREDRYVRAVVSKQMTNNFPHPISANKDEQAQNQAVSTTNNMADLKQSYTTCCSL